MWSQNETVLVYTPQTPQTPPPSSGNIKGIESFDFDHTLACQKSGKKFPINQDDWMPMYSGNVVKDALILSHGLGNLIVIFTNQGGVEKKQITVEFLKHRIQAFIDYVGIPIYVFAALGSDHYRKPSTEMWTYCMEKVLNIPLDTDVPKLYVGDAAGRIKNWIPNTSKDFSCSDRKFAHNVGIEFQTPEEYFLNEEPTTKWEWGGFDPKTYVPSTATVSLTKSTNQRLVLLIGPPASGKSSFVKHYLQSYTRINRDTLKTKAKCLKETKLALQRGESVVCDNTNPDVASRKDYIDIAKLKSINSQIEILAIVIMIDKPLVMHLNDLRVKMTQGQTKKIPSVCYNIYYKKSSYPTSSEGIDKIVEVPFRLEFEDDRHKELFMQLS
jgi:bifunctional polynucleotide phosphatase/kinase